MANDASLPSMAAAHPMARFYDIKIRGGRFSRYRTLANPSPEQTEGPGTNSEAFPLFVCVRCRTGEFYADACTPAIQVRAMEATEQ
jgi:hypothetical protein